MAWYDCFKLQGEKKKDKWLGLDWRISDLITNPIEHIVYFFIIIFVVKHYIDANFFFVNTKLAIYINIVLSDKTTNQTFIMFSSFPSEFIIWTIIPS